MAGLSKSRIIAHLQCPKRLWLHLNRKDLEQVDASVQRGYDAGHQVGDLARRRFEDGLLMPDDLREALHATTQAISRRKPLFEATFQHDGVLTRADLMTPVRGGWNMIEVKSSTSLKDYHLKDAAVQTWVTEKAGVTLRKVALSHIDTSFVYGGDGDYNGMFRDVDITGEVRELQPQVVQWVKAAKATAASKTEPRVAPGEHCKAPFQCPFSAYCKPPSGEAYPVELLPNTNGKKLAAALRAEGYGDLRKVPASRMPEHALLQRIHRQTSKRTAWIDEAAAALMAQLPWPRHYLDFESINPAVPIWAGTRPYQHTVFQWSCHTETKQGVLTHKEWLADGAGDPRPGFIASLLKAVGTRGSILVYNSSFEVARIQELARDFPQHSDALLALLPRVVDLLPIGKDHYYHRDQQGSWSIKNVLPTIAPQLDYANLEVGDGEMAMDAFHELLDPATTEARRAAVRANLLTYCGRDTLAMVHVAHCLEQTPLPNGAEE